MVSRERVSRGAAGQHQCYKALDDFKGVTCRVDPRKDEERQKVDKSKGRYLRSETRAEVAYKMFR